MGLRSDFGSSGRNFGFGGASFELFNFCPFNQSHLLLHRRHLQNARAVANKIFADSSGFPQHHALKPVAPTMKNICSWTVLAELLLALGARGESSSTEAFSGNAPLDLAPFGYVYRADAPGGKNPPETQWLTNGQADVLAGAMWEEHRPMRRVEIQFAEEAPEPAQLTRPGIVEDLLRPRLAWGTYHYTLGL